MARLSGEKGSKKQKGSKVAAPPFRPPSIASVSGGVKGSADFTLLQRRYADYKAAHHGKPWRGTPAPLRPAGEAQRETAMAKKAEIMVRLSGGKGDKRAKGDKGTKSPSWRPPSMASVAGSDKDTADFKLLQRRYADYKAAHHGKPWRGIRAPLRPCTPTQYRHKAPHPFARPGRVFGPS